MRTSLPHTTAVTALWLVEYSLLSQCIRLCPNTNTRLKGLGRWGSCSRLLRPLTHYFSATTMELRWWVAPDTAALSRPPRWDPATETPRTLPPPRRYRQTRKRNPSTNLCLCRETACLAHIILRNNRSKGLHDQCRTCKDCIFTDKLYINALLSSHLICCPLGLTELCLQVTEVSQIQMQWFGMLYLSAYKALDTPLHEMLP